MIGVLNRLSKLDTRISIIVKQFSDNSIVRIYCNVVGLFFAFVFAALLALMPILYLFNPFYTNWFIVPNFSNKRIEIVKQIILENAGNKSESAVVSMSNTFPEIMNYKYKLNVAYSLDPYKYDKSKNYFKILVPSHSRRRFVVKYIFQLGNRIEITRGNIAVDASAPTIQSFDPTVTDSNRNIDSTAKAITVNNTTPYDKAETIFKYVIDYMTYTYDYRYAHAGAASAYSTGKGVCEEYAGLFTVMAQAVGLPCRYDYGIRISELTNSYQEISTGHAWPEIKLKDGQWVPIEVTQNNPGTRRSMDWLKANLDRAFRNSYGIYIRFNMDSQVSSVNGGNITSMGILLVKQF
ncbi:transglutaminase-like domain-containing protein [Desulfotomaculum copahuensis]|uniref:Transglutaminase-like domain-containing protein n=1 Tax=Desulfotomaculum copahuensis TaxID=1838280 RepID=A0A1B7LG91_9FIRM|nr:transglutaminase-like domain-containing protein [Desulfotomaculum copahuensis]OAT83668.1 hypothetical protein A6M21_07470 [Desulfotomaculum copahuensis]